MRVEEKIPKKRDCYNEMEHAGRRGVEEEEEEEERWWWAQI